MPRRLPGAFVALALAPGSAGAVTPSVAVRSVAPGCQPRGAFAEPATGPPSFATGSHTYVVVTGTAAPCGALPVTTTASAGAVRLRWNAAPGAAGYRIYRDGETVATGVACCEYTDTSPATVAGAPPPVVGESARAGSGPDLIVTETFAYDAPAATLGTDVLRLPAGLFLTGAVTGEALAVIDGKPVPGTFAPTDDPARLQLTLRPDGEDPTVLSMVLSRRADGALDVATATGGLRIDRLTRTFAGAGVVFPTSCAAKSVLVDAVGAHASAPLQATDCAALPFTPAAALGLDGTLFSADVIQPTGQAAARAITITLPEGLSAATGGQATGSSPLAPVAPLPFTATRTSGGRSVLTLDRLPEAPLTDLRLQTQVTRAPCATDAAADIAYVGHNGATVTERSPVTITNAMACPEPPAHTGDDPPVQLPARPGVAVTARGARSGRLRLELTIRAGNAVAGSRLRRCRIQLPPGLRLERGAQRRLKVTVDARRSTRVSVRRHALTVRAPAARIVSVDTRRGALTAGRRARRRLAFRFAVLTRSGRTYRIVKRVTPRS